MTVVDPDSTQTSRRRLLEAGKALFARFGFEQTSTAIIAREAGTSESQLVRYYKGKAGLLEAIFNDCWAALNQHVQGVVVLRARSQVYRRMCAEEHAADEDTPDR